MLNQTDGNMHPNVFRQILSLRQTEKDTLHSFLYTLLFFVLVAVIEFGALYFNRVNQTFGNPFLQGIWTFVALAAIPLLLKNVLAKIYLFIVVFYTLLIETTHVVLAVCFKVPFDADILVVLSATNVQECTEFIKNYFGWWNAAGIIAGVLALFVLAGVAIKKLSFIPSKRTVCIGILALLPFAASVSRYYIIGDGPKGFTNTILLRMFLTAQEYHRQWASLLEACKNPQIPDIEVHRGTVKPVTGIIVIGESAIRHRWGIYGHSRQTTPELAKRNDIIVFNDVVSAWGSTTMALRLMLTQSTLKNRLDSRCSLVDVYKKAGYDVVLLSNQARCGTHSGPIHMMFLHANETFYLREVPGSTPFDDGLLPYLDQKLAGQKDRPLLIFLHLMGSHTDPADRYPQGFDPFQSKAPGISKQEKIRREYDNSLAFTDRFLGEVAKRIAARENPAFMLYLSDHGSVVEDGTAPPRSSKSRNPDVFEIPFVLQTNSEYNRVFPEIVTAAKQNAGLPIQTDRVFFGLAALGGIRPVDRQTNRQSVKQNVFSLRYQPPRVRKISEGTVVYKQKKSSTAPLHGK